MPDARNAFVTRMFGRAASRESPFEPAGWTMVGITAAERRLDATARSEPTDAEHDPTGGRP
jgi:hypothetical protein